MKKIPQETVKRAKAIVDIATGVETKPDEKDPNAVALGKKGAEKRWGKD